MSDTETNLRNEANGTDATFEFRGETFVIPTEYDDLPLSYIEAATDGKPSAIQARELLGPEQWAKVQAMGLKGRDIEGLVDSINKATGITSGNSEASSD
jgi:hypothetical protein